MQSVARIVWHTGWLLVMGQSAALSACSRDHLWIPQGRGTLTAVTPLVVALYRQGAMPKDRHGIAILIGPISEGPAVEVADLGSLAPPKPHRWCRLASELG